jgi:hypothetical protein
MSNLIMYLNYVRNTNSLPPRGLFALYTTPFPCTEQMDAHTPSRPTQGPQSADYTRQQQNTSPTRGRKATKKMYLEQSAAPPSFLGDSPRKPGSAEDTFRKYTDKINKIA